MAKITKTDAQWRELLSEQAYKVTREHATERAGSHAGFPQTSGTFSCVCCGEPLFEQDAKYDSGCGWPSFFQPLTDGAIEESVDDSMAVRRTEVHCNKCDAHLGHVFPDGPADQTGLRYCINGVALKFKAD
jgi:peptide-methionine (R)-S-oxide reductase